MITILFLLVAVYAGQQARILGENYTIEDEEDSRVGTVRTYLSDCRVFREIAKIEQLK